MVHAEPIAWNGGPGHGAREEQLLTSRLQSISRGCEGLCYIHIFFIYLVSRLGWSYGENIQRPGLGCQSDAM